MARIRTVKPEFFTSEDIVELSAFARLLYIAIWCEADREGRLIWKPKTLKIRYFPTDEIDIDSLCDELISRNLVVLYGGGLAYIPTFTRHQHLNPRESKSAFPDPAQEKVPDFDASSRVSDASSRDSDAQGGREGKGRREYASGRDEEKDAHSQKPATVTPIKTARDSQVPLDENFTPDADLVLMANSSGLDLQTELETFKAHYQANGDLKANWQAQFRKWLLHAKQHKADAAKREQQHPQQKPYDPFAGAI